MSPIIETRRLTKRYHGRPALEGVDLTLGPGAVGLLGPNGAGKSTFIKCLLQLQQKDSGEAFLMGMNIDQQGREARKRIGYAPEQDCHIPNMLGCEYVTYCGQLSGLPFEVARRRAHEMLDFVGMEQERYRKVDTYSTGMKQRVKIAQALVHDPDLVFLDEPTNGLDPKGQLLILELIRNIWKRSGISVVLSSHLLNDVEGICDQIVIIAQGKILVNDKLETLKQARKPVAELSHPTRARELATALKGRGWPSELLSNGNVRVDHGHASLDPLLQDLREIGISPQEIKGSPNALNELFVQALETERSAL